MFYILPILYKKNIPTSVFILYFILISYKPKSPVSESVENIVCDLIESYANCEF